MDLKLTNAIEQYLLDNGANVYLSGKVYWRKGKEVPEISANIGGREIYFWSDGLIRVTFGEENVGIATGIMLQWPNDVVKHNIQRSFA